MCTSLRGYPEEQSVSTSTVPRSAGAPATAAGLLPERLVNASSVVAAVVCLALLAWGHLGLGAALVPPNPGPPVQTAVAGPYRVTLRAGPAPLTAAGPNTLSFAVADQAGHPFAGAKVALAATMTTMPMDAADLQAIPAGPGRFDVHPRFSMAGDWRLTLSVSQPGQPWRSVTFTIGVRWR